MDDILLDIKIIDKITRLKKDFRSNNNINPTYLILNAYTLSMLRQELGYDDLYDLKKYKGLEILYTLSEDEGSLRIL
jgi:hypothetical protein